MILLLSLLALLPIHVRADLPDASTQGIGTVKAWSQARLHEAESSHPGQNLYPSPGFWGEEIIYQIQVDRFNNGNLSNDGLNIEEHQRYHQGTQDWFGLPDYRHGGDLKGIHDRLDYLKDLGVTTLWLTPILKHNGSYHGYCTTDFTEIDPGFGSKEELRGLVAAAHAKGIKVVLDIVVNHMCNAHTSYRQMARHYECSEELNANNWSGLASSSIHQGELGFASDFFPPFKTQYFFNRCGANTQADMQGTGAASVYGDFVANMFDFDTRNQDFQEIFTNLHKYWISYADIDGFRLDAVKHVTEDFVAFFSTSIRDYARSVDKTNFLIVGEVAGPSAWIGRRVGTMYSNPQNPDEHGSVPRSLTARLWDLRPTYSRNPTAPYPGMNAAYDFAHGGTALDVLLNRRPSRALEEHFSGTYFSDLAAQNDYRLNWNLLEIHDWPRFVSHDRSSPSRSMLGLSYLALAEGAPIIYYGMEQGFNGDCHADHVNAGQANQEILRDCQGSNHAIYRQDMFVGGAYRLGSTVPEINQLAYIGRMSPEAPQNWLTDPMLNRNHDVYRTARKMNRLRRSCAALKYGSTRFRWTESAPAGILAFSRVDGIKEVLVVINTGPQKRRIPGLAVEASTKGQIWQNALNASEMGWGEGGGKLNFGGLEINPNTVMVFVPSGELGDWSSELQVHLCK